MMTTRSAALYDEARTVIPGGVNSPVRAFGGVGGHPVFFDSATGCSLTDADGKTYIDYVLSWGAMILGHGHPNVLSALHQAIDKSLSFGAPAAIEVAMAKKIIQHVPAVEKVRMVNSGTEATLSAIRLARGYTGKNKIIKFEGCYHGHHDALLVKAGSGLLTFGNPTSPGIPASYLEHTLVADYNDLEQVAALFSAHPDDIAAIIVEPVAANMNCVLPQPGFLHGLRELCDRHQSLLIFDEVITGFRVDLAGAQGYYNVLPDLTTLGKIIGGGLPIGAFGGRASIMAHLSPEGAVYQAGTLSGNPVTLAAGLATLTALESPAFYAELDRNTHYFVSELERRAARYSIPLRCQQIGGLFGLFFTEQTRISSFDEVMRCNTEQYKQFFHGMLKAGVYLAPSAFECGFLSQAHTPMVLDQTLDIAERVLASMSS